MHRIPKKPLNLIAEIGVNYDGTLQGASTMICASAMAGADYVKFQLFNKETIAESPLKDQLTKYILGENEVKFLKAKADEFGLGFILTPMYIEAVDIAKKYADPIKIRYADHENKELMDVAEATNKILLISVPKYPLNAYNPNFKYLYCLPHYPPEYDMFNLESACACHGLSTHFPNTIAETAWAINRSWDEGWIEKHVKLLDTTPIDDKVSITFTELNYLKNELKTIEKFKRIRM